MNNLSLSLYLWNLTCHWAVQNTWLQSCQISGRCPRFIESGEWQNSPPIWMGFWLYWYVLVRCVPKSRRRRHCIHTYKYTHSHTHKYWVDIWKISRLFTRNSSSRSNCSRRPPSSGRKRIVQITTHRRSAQPVRPIWLCKRCFRVPTL